MARKRLKIGDVLEINTPCGLAYFQHINVDELMGSLIRILPGIYQTRPGNLDEIVKQKELYCVYFPTSVALSRDLIEWVTNTSVPEWAQYIPIMRRPAARDGQGKVLTWWIINGAEQHLVRQLSDAEKKCHYLLLGTTLY